MPDLFMLELNFHPFPNLRTKRLLLKRITSNNVKDIFALRSNENLMKFIQRPVAKTEEDALALIKIIESGLEKNESITWGITIKDEPLIIGTIGFWRMQKEDYRAEIGYMLNNNFQRQRIMQEAIIEVLHYGFNVMKLHSVEANVHPENIASIKLLKKIGFVQEAHFKENYFFEGKFYDSYIFSLLAANFKSN